MKVEVLVIATLSLAMVAACTKSPQDCSGDADCFVGERCAAQRCVGVVEITTSAPAPGALPAELLEGLNISSGYKVFLEPNGWPRVTVYGEDDALKQLRWDGYRWERQDIYPALVRKPFDGTSVAQRRGDGRLALCTSDAAGRLLFVEEREDGSWSEEVIVEEPGEDGPQNCKISMSATNAPLITYYTGDIPRWVSGAGQTRLMLARRIGASWATELISDRWHGFTVATTSPTSNGVQLYVGQRYDDAMAVDERTRRLTLIQELRLEDERPEVLELAGKVASGDAVLIHGARTYIMHSSGDGGPSFKLLLSRSAEQRWITYPLAIEGAEGSFLYQGLIFADPEHEDAVELLFALTDQAATQRKIMRASLRGESLSVRPLELDGVEGELESVDAAMDKAGALHVFYEVQGSGGLGYWVGR